MEVNTLIIGFLILAAGIISIEIGISVAIIEIIAGIVATNALGITELPWLDFLAHFGLLGIMFFAGFEVDGTMVKKHWKKSLVIGLTSYFVPFIAILIAAQYFFSLSLTTSLLLAIGLSTTSLALVYAELREQKLLNEQSRQILLSSATIIDVMSMLSLILVFEGMSITSVLLLMFLFPALFVLPYLGKWVFDRYVQKNIEFKIRFVFLLLAALTIISEGIGIHAALLAFLTGFMFSSLIVDYKELEDKLHAIVFGFMAPLFFFQAGLSMNLSFLNIETIQIIILLGLIAFGGRYLTSYTTVRFILGPSVQRLAGLIFNLRLSFGIIIASFGLKENLLTPSMYAAIVSIIILASICSTIFTKITKNNISYISST